MCNIVKGYSFFSRNYDLSCFADANCEVRSAFLKQEAYLAYFRRTRHQAGGRADSAEGIELMLT